MIWSNVSINSFNYLNVKVLILLDNSNERRDKHIININGSQTLFTLLEFFLDLMLIVMESAVRVGTR